jgi:hypothetical protein
MKVTKMSDDNKPPNGDSKIFILNENIKTIIDDSDKKDLTPRVAAYRICRSIQNIYLEIAGQQEPDLGNSYDEVQRSFILREYGEMFLLRNIEDQVILDIYQNINTADDWNKAVLPLNWGYISFQDDPKVSFMLFLTMVLQTVVINSDDEKYSDAGSKSELE